MPKIRTSRELKIPDERVNDPQTPVSGRDGALHFTAERAILDRIPRFDLATTNA